MNATEFIAKTMYEIWANDQSSEPWNGLRPDERAAWLRVAQTFMNAAWTAHASNPL